MRLVLPALLAGLLALSAATAPATCSCSMPESVKDGFATETSPVYKARAVSSIAIPGSPYSWTVMDVKVTFRGCAPESSHIIVKSPKTAAGCGVAFEPNTTYMVTLRQSGSATPPPHVAAVGYPVYSAVSCNYNKKWEDVSYDDQKFCYYEPVRGC